MLKKIDHFGIAVHPIEKGKEVALQIARSAFLRFGAPHTALLEPTAAGKKQIAFLHPKSSNGVLTKCCSGAQQ